MRIFFCFLISLAAFAGCSPQPKHIALSPDGKSIWVSDDYSDTLFYCVAEEKIRCVDIELNAASSAWLPPWFKLRSSSPLFQWLAKLAGLAGDTPGPYIEGQNDVYITALTGDNKNEIRVFSRETADKLLKKKQPNGNLMYREFFHKRPLNSIPLDHRGRRSFKDAVTGRMFSVDTQEEVDLYKKIKNPKQNNAPRYIEIEVNDGNEPQADSKKQAPATKPTRESVLEKYKGKRIFKDTVDGGYVSADTQDDVNELNKFKNPKQNNAPRFIEVEN